MSEKTEEPTPKRLRDLRRKGEVPKSSEVASATLFVACVSCLCLSAALLREQFTGLTLLAAQVQALPFDEAFAQLSAAAWRVLLVCTAPWMVLVVVAATASLMGQFGFLISFEALKPSLKKIDPANGFKKIFSVNNLVETLKSILKITVLVLALLHVGTVHVRDLLAAPRCGLACVEAAFAAMLYDLLLIVVPVFIVVAGVDLLFQRFQFHKRNRMSKDEVKREHKDSEGDPLIKGMRRQLHQRLANESGLQVVRNAAVVVTNPVHLAIALYYEADKVALPMVIAKAQNLDARRAVGIAEEAGVPVMQNVPLAWDLFEQAELNQYIPRDLIPRVAEILRAVQKLAQDGAEADR